MGRASGFRPARPRRAATIAWRLAAASAALVLAATATLDGQRGGRGLAQTARAGAALDLTGYWVSVITEDWKFRMVTPRKGVYDALTLNAEGRRIGDTWDPVRDEASGEACRSYGAAGIMRVPGRIRIAWESDDTLRIDTDAGSQTRLFHFGSPPAPAPASWQGRSAAQWQSAPGGRGGARAGSLKVVTTHLRPGYIRRNGAPYSAAAVVTEYFDVNTTPNGDRWLTVTTKVDDPTYFTRPYLTSSDFKRLPDDTGWSPTPCTAG
jgi:hypothetical protein